MSSKKQTQMSTEPVAKSELDEHWDEFNVSFDYSVSPWEKRAARALDDMQLAIEGFADRVGKVLARRRAGGIN